MPSCSWGCMVNWDNDGIEFYGGDLAVCEDMERFRDDHPKGCTSPGQHERAYEYVNDKGDVTSGSGATRLSEDGPSITLMGANDILVRHVEVAETEDDVFADHP